MLYQLSEMNVGGNILHCILNIYSKTSSCIRLNGNTGSWFDVTSGVCQGDNLSPLVNNVTLDSLAKSLNLGVSEK